ncbi:enoyl-CoA hydratase [compost metagenome]
MAAQAPLGIRATLASAHQTLDEGEKAAAANLPAVARQLLGSDDAKEGLRAMLERRDGHFKGK